MFITIHWIHCFLLSFSVGFFPPFSEMKTTQSETKLKPPGAQLQLSSLTFSAWRRAKRGEQNVCLCVLMVFMVGIRLVWSCFSSAFASALALFSFSSLVVVVVVGDSFANHFSSISNFRSKLHIFSSPPSRLLWISARSFAGVGFINKKKRSFEREQREIFPISFAILLPRLCSRFSNWQSDPERGCFQLIEEFRGVLTR